MSNFNSKALTGLIGDIPTFPNEDNIQKKDNWKQKWRRPHLKDSTPSPIYDIYDMIFTIWCMLSDTCFLILASW